MLHVSTAGGRQFDVELEEGETIATLKKKLFELIRESEECEAASCSGFKLLHGLDALSDDWVLEEHGITEKEQLTLVISPGPSGEYHFDSSRLGRRDGPAGRNTTASVKAEFHGGTVNISVHETEITSLIRYPDSDPYTMGERFAHDYTARVTFDDGEQGGLRLEVLECNQKGLIRNPKPEVLKAKFQDDEVMLELPFAAGACNDGVAGLKWITMSKLTDEAKVDPFAPPDESDEDEDLSGLPEPEPRRRGPLERAMRYVLRKSQ